MMSPAKKCGRWVGCRPPSTLLPVTVLLMLAATAGASGQTLERRALEADALRIEDFAGLLTIAVRDAATIDMAFAAHERTLGLDDSVVEEGTLRLRFEHPPQVTIQRDESFTPRLSVAADGMSITATDAAPPGPEDPPELVLLVPVETSIAVDGLVGDASIGAIDAALAVRLVSGDVRAESARDAELVVAGAGGIAVGHVTGDLVMRLEGSGDIVVAGGQVERLEAVLDGSGEIVFAGSSASARMVAAGAGLIRLGPVDRLDDAAVEPGVIVEIDGREQLR